MSGVRFSFEIEGKAVFDRAFNRITEKISDFRDVWVFIFEWIKDRNQRQYFSEGAVGASGKWKELKPSYEDWKLNNYPFMPLGRRTDRTYQSLTKNTSDTVFESRPMEMVYGTAVPYAKHFHVKRPLFSFTEKDKRDLQKVIQRQLVQFVRKAGFTETELTERVG